MVSEGAAKTKFMLAKTSHSWDYATELAAPNPAINSILTVRSRTPLEILFVVHISTSQQLAVPEGGKEKRVSQESHQTDSALGTLESSICIALTFA